MNSPCRAPKRRLLPYALALLLATAAQVGCAGSQSTERKFDGPTLGTLPGIDGPESTVIAFFQALHKNQPDYANTLIARFREVSRNEMLEGLRILGDRLKDSKWQNNVVQSRTRGDAGVVVVRQYQDNQSVAPNVDPIYLINQYGAWRILPFLTNYNRPSFRFSQEQLHDFQDLDAWFRERKRALER